MTPQQQNKAIAEWCGAKTFLDLESGLWSIVFPDGRYGPNHRGGISDEHAWRVCCPNYHGSLDAVHEAESKLTDSDRVHYFGILYTVIHGFFRWPALGPTAEMIWDTIHTTSAQRCEALLRTLGLWRDDE